MMIHVPETRVIEGEGGLVVEWVAFDGTWAWAWFTRDGSLLTLDDIVVSEVVNGLVNVGDPQLSDIPKGARHILRALGYDLDHGEVSP